MKLWQRLPRIRYNAPSIGEDDEFLGTYKLAETCFKVVGWCIIIGTLHYGFVKTNSIFFGLPEDLLKLVLAWCVYAFFMRITIVLPSGHIVTFRAHWGRWPFHWPSLVAAILVMYGVQVLISRWADAVASLQAK
jgi:hypothetical protein